ncbi:MAG TPA: T9SS type A sorting domain-containing protein, partial [Flavipsychrobacter sp.]|nr:T9SS type A sorting domain-containing protein [Flavipsychrobacter sp.]
LRTSMSATTWGEQIATGAIAKDAEFTKDFTFSLTSSITPAYADQPSTWDKTKLVPFAVIYKVNGSKHDYVNGARHYEFPATIEGLNAVNNMAVYPNPAFGQTAVSFDVPNQGSVTINVLDNVGRTVYTSGALQVSAGRTLHNISTANLAAGLYNINVVSEHGISTQRLSVVK